jgi:hypothetical protein
MENSPVYGSLRPTHKKIMLVGETRRSVLLQVLSITDQYPVDDPICIRCDGAQFVCELYLIQDDRSAHEKALALIMQV